MSQQNKFLLPAITLLGLALRLINLNQSLWLDEAITALAVKNNTFFELITKFAPTDFHPPLYYLFLKIWTSFFGLSEVSIRFPSIIFSVGTGYFIYLIGEKFFNKKVALLASLFWAVNPLSVYYSQEARMYSLAAFLIAGSIYFFIKQNYFWYILFFAAALYTDYVPILMLPVFLLLSENKEKFIIYNLSLIILFLPWLPILTKQLQSGFSLSSTAPLWSQVVGGFELKAIPLTLVKFIIGRISINNKILYGLIIAPISLIYLFILSRARNRTLWFWLVTPIFLGFIISFKISIFSYFRFLFVLPAFVLLLANGVRGNKIFAGFVIAVSLGSLLIFNLNPQFQRENWRTAANYINSDKGVVVMPSAAQDAPLNYYNSNIVVQDKNSLNLIGYKNVYLIRYVQEIFDPSDTERKIIEVSGFKRTEEKAFNGVLIWKYSL